MVAKLPHSGKTLTIKAHGNFTEVVEEGAYMNLQVKYGLITLIKQTADLCEQMSNVDEECPLSGEKTITKDVELPTTIPPVIPGLLSNVQIIQLTADFAGQILSICGRLHKR